MALSVRSTASLKAGAARTVTTRRTVRPVAAMNAKVAGAAAAATAAVALAAAPVQAAELISTIASAAEGYPFVPPSWAPAVFVPLTGLFLPGLVMASFFVYIEKDAQA